MMRRGRMLVASGICLALGLIGGEARAEFLVQVSASLSAPTTDSGSITAGQSTLTPAAISGLPVDPAAGAPAPVTFGATQVGSGNITGADAFNVPYTWTLSLAHDVDGAPTGAAATLLVSGDVSVGETSLSNIFATGPLSAPASLTVDGMTLYAKLQPWTSPGRPFSEAPDFGVRLSTSSAAFRTAPEPATVALLGGGGALLAVPRPRRRPRPRG
jgi:hypothetical protein